MAADTDRPVGLRPAASFGARLQAAVRERGPLCVGIDPHPELLLRWGLTDDPAGVAAFTRTVIDALADRVAIFKPQSAFFERFGSAGIGVLESTVRRLREAGALVLLDVKRGDIGSTMAAYADAYLDPASPLAVDAVTASPYLGVGALSPLVQRARDHRGGFFALALTSNPEAAAVQRATLPDGRPVAQHVVDEISQLNRVEREEIGQPGPGSFGVVIGATVGSHGLDLTTLEGPILVPGLGAQGGTADDLGRLFGEARELVLPTYSREVLGAGPGLVGLREAVVRAREACQRALEPTSSNRTIPTT